MPAGELSNMRKHPSDWKSKRKSKDMRVAAVLCMILAMHSGGCAATNFVEMYPDYAAQVKEDHGRFCKRHYETFTMYGTVADRKHSGKPSKVSKEVALQASSIFKAGTVVRAYPHADAKHELDVHIWWTSTEVACQQCQALRDMCNLCNITCKQLLKYMKKADPSLVRRRIDVNLDLTREQKTKRKSAAEKLWQMFQREPDMLSRMYFVDECKIWMSTLASKSVKVYCDAHDDDVRAVLPCKWYRNQKPCPDVKLTFVSAVNPVHGAVFLRFTTGITDNKDPAGNLNAPYYVSV
jgi:hypothetical protein